MKLPLTLTAGLVAALILGFAYVRDPAEGYPFLPGCGFKNLTGYHCPGCGGTRSIHALLHGRIGEAFDFNPLLIIILIIGTVATVRWLILRKWHGVTAPWTMKRSVALTATIFVSLTMFWIVRNLPWYPFFKPPALEMRK